MNSASAGSAAVVAEAWRTARLAAMLAPRRHPERRPRMRTTLAPHLGPQISAVPRAARPACVPPTLPEPPSAAAPPAARADRLAPLLARALARRAAVAQMTAPLLQRAVIALDGPQDSTIAKRITRNCLDNLTSIKARGDQDGPADPPAIAAPDLAEGESLYILGHGNPQSIAGLTPGQLGDWIVHWYGAQRYSGKIKLVACSSAVSPDPTNAAASYAEALGTHIAGRTSWRFHPSAVDGVLGVAWVDEVSGKIVMFDDPEYDRQEQLGTDVEGAFAKTDPGKRHTRLTSIFGAPNATGSSTHTGKGTAKVRYFLPAKGIVASVVSGLTRLLPCIP